MRGPVKRPDLTFTYELSYRGRRWTQHELMVQAPTVEIGFARARALITKDYLKPNVHFQYRNLQLKLNG